VRVVEKVGFRLEGRALRYLRINGVWEDHDVYALTIETGNDMRALDVTMPFPQTRLPPAPHPVLRDLVRETRLDPGDFVLPLYIRTAWRAAWRFRRCRASSGCRSRPPWTRPAWP